MRRTRTGQGVEAYPRALAACLAAALVAAVCAPPRATVRAARRQSAKADAQKSWRLGQGETAERELRAGEAHLYLLKLSAGRFVRLSAAPAGGDLVLTLFAPGGARLEEMRLRADSPLNEPLAFLTEAAGVYRLELRAPSGTAPVSYALTLEEVRAAAPADATRIAAERAYAEGERAQYAGGGPDSLREAIRHYERALALWREAGDREGAASALGSIGGARASLGEHALAVESYLRELELLRAGGDRLQEAVVAETVGRLYYSPLGNKAEALRHLGDALRLYRQAGHVEGEARTLTGLGKVYSELGATSEEKLRSLAPLVEALDIQRRARNRYYEGDALGNLMYAWRALGRPREAVFFGKQAVNVFQEIRAGITDLESDTQEKFLQSKEDIYRALAALLIEQRRLSEARQVIGMLKEEEYSEFTARSGGETPAPARRADMTEEEAAWARRYKELADRLTARGREHGELKRKEARTAAEEQRLVELEAEVGFSAEVFSKFVVGLRSELGDAPDAQRLVKQLEDSGGMMEDLREIGPGVVALYTVVTKEKYYVILVTPDVQRAFEYKIKVSDLGQKIIAFRDKLQDRNSDPLPLAQELYRVIVGPVEKDLKDAGAETLMWSFDWVLRYVPVAALHDGERYMVERYNNVIFTPATLTHFKDRSSRKWRGTGFGVSKAHGDFRALPGVPDELRGIFRPEADGAAEPAASGIMPGRVLLDDEFTEESLREMLRQGRPVVHIASHFLFRPGDSNSSFLLLGDGQRLSLSRIKTTLSFAGVELLTLSACDTASGGEGDSGREVESFAVLAQRLKAKAVVATLWPVADASTTRMMLDFYRFRDQHPDISIAEALRQSQLALLRGDAPAAPAAPGGGDRGLSTRRSSAAARGEGGGAAAKSPFAHPYFWAPFLLLGNGR